VIYRLVVALVIYSGMPSTDMKLMTAVVVIVALCLTSSRNYIAAKLQGKNAKGEKKNG
jgi:ABC-type uncharacterized transport system permease subunit